MNAYELEPESAAVADMVNELARSHEPYCCPDTYPEMRADGHSLSLYRLVGNDPLSDVARSVEGRVLSVDWGVSPHELAASRDDIEPSSIWFVLLRRTDGGRAVPIGSLSVGDCLAGPSETLRAAEAICERNGHQLPADLSISPGDLLHGLWDVMQVAVLGAYRTTHATPWLYHALYRSSIESEVGRWVANMNEREFSNLTALGTPFTVVNGVEGTEWWSQAAAADQHSFAFQTLKVAEVAGSLGEQVKSLLTAHAVDRNPFWLRLADIASIAISGSSAGLAPVWAPQSSGPAAAAS